MQVVELKAKSAKTKAPKKRAKSASKIIKKRPIAVWPMVATTVALLLVSLPHQAEGLILLTSCPAWQAWSMALAIDGLTMATEFAEMTAATETRREIKYACHGLMGMSLSLSAYLNSLALGGDLQHMTNIAVGCFIPAAIALATYVLAHLKK